MSKAYEILYDDEKRRLYDLHGMEAFDKSHGNGMGTGVDLEEMLQHMYGVRGRDSRHQKGEDEEHPYQVSLEELYRGKTAKFTSKKNVICSHCKGSGGREKAKPKRCGSCHGQGSLISLGHLFDPYPMKVYRFQGRSSIYRSRLGHSSYGHVHFLQGRGNHIKGQRSMQEM